MTARCPEWWLAPLPDPLIQLNSSINGSLEKGSRFLLQEDFRFFPNPEAGTWTQKSPTRSSQVGLYEIGKINLR
jgi:hypothetical protein